MKVKETTIPGCYELYPAVFEDTRGVFVKTFHLQSFKEHNLETAFVEDFYTYSHQGVLRGMHFQIPPYEQAKLVYCASGSVLDAVVDLRSDSPSFGKHELLTLSSDVKNMLYISSGLAHGFYVLSENALVMYKTSSIHSPEHDTGILWNSCGIPWPVEEPLISKRDQGFTKFPEFISPFSYLDDSRER